jgi:hypothetical protein
VISSDRATPKATRPRMEEAMMLRILRLPIATLRIKTLPVLW